MTRLAPKLWKLRTMLLLKPVTIETIAMTVATPTTIPRTVNPARSLCRRTASIANRRFSPNPRLRCWNTGGRYQQSGALPPASCLLRAGYSYRSASIGSSREAFTAG